MKLEYVVNEIIGIAPIEDGVVLCKSSNELVLPSKSFEVTLASISNGIIIPIQGGVIINTLGITGVFGIPSSRESSRAKKVEVIWDM